MFKAYRVLEYNRTTNQYSEPQATPGLCAERTYTTRLEADNVASYLNSFNRAGVCYMSTPIRVVA